MIASDSAARLKAMLENAGAAVEHRVLPVGHELSQMDATLARGFIAAIDAPARAPST